MQTMTISLSPQQASRIQQAVETGEYTSCSEVVRDALRLWEQREDIRSLELAQLKRAYDEGISSGPARAVEADALLEEFKARLQARA